MNPRKGGYMKNIKRCKFIISPEDRENIARRRLALGITQEQIARLMDISVWTYNRWENGKETPSRRNYQLLLELLEKLEGFADKGTKNWRELVNGWRIRYSP